MAGVYVFPSVHVAGAGTEELSPETVGKCEFLADERRLPERLDHPETD